MESINLLKTAIKQLQNGERTCIGCVVRQVEKDLKREMDTVDYYANISDDVFPDEDCDEQGVGYGHTEKLGGKLARETQRKRNGNI